MLDIFSMGILNQTRRSTLFSSIKKNNPARMTVIPVWSLSLPLPAILIIAVSVYMVLLVGALWCRHCVKAQCSEQCSNCCAYITPCEYCLVCAESCDCRLPSLRTCLDQTCPSPSWDCACTCQRPDCNSINCLCFEIKFR